MSGKPPRRSSQFSELTRVLFARAERAITLSQSLRMECGVFMAEATELARTSISRLGILIPHFSGNN